MCNVSIRKVIFNDPATIVLWSDGTKTVVKCGPEDSYDMEKGLAMAIVKKMTGLKQAAAITTESMHKLANMAAGKAERSE